MENPIDAVKAWATAEIEKAKIDAEIAALTCVRDAVDGKITDLRSQRDGVQAVKLRELGK